LQAKQACPVLKGRRYGIAKQKPQLNKNCGFCYCIMVCGKQTIYIENWIEKISAFWALSQIYHLTE
jgi:hypothetical protein